MNVKIDRRHDRRALTNQEMANLLRVTNQSPFRFGMTGPERAMLYKLQ